MKRSGVGICFSMAAVLVTAFLSVGTAAAQSNTAVGAGALPSPSTNDLFDSAFGFDALRHRHEAECARERDDCGDERQ